MSVSLLGMRGRVSYSPSLATAEALCATVHDPGYEASLVGESTDSPAGPLAFAREARMWRTQFLGSLTFSLPVFVIAMVAPHTPAAPLTEAELIPGASPQP